ncbi:MAG: hypothetical protein ACREDK_02295 [Thermoplasmata archaeon]
MDRLASIIVVIAVVSALVLTLGVVVLWRGTSTENQIRNTVARSIDACGASGRNCTSLAPAEVQPGWSAAAQEVLEGTILIGVALALVLLDVVFLLAVGRLRIR